MAKVKEPFNPFYGLLLLAGVLFSISACAYGVMAFTAVKNGPIVAGPSSGQRLLVFLDDHGGKLLSGELAVLAIATIGVMFWDQRATSRAETAAAANDVRHAGESERPSGDSP